MDLRDFIVTPLLIIIIVVAAYLIRPYVTDEINRRYFFPALILKMLGAIALGLIYQFYYNSGDTFIYHTHGSRQIWEAFMSSPSKGLKLLFATGKYDPGLYEYADKIWYFRDQKSYFIIRLAFLFDLLTFSTYSATAVLFAVLSFAGGWMLFLTFHNRFPQRSHWLAMASLFVPSVIFWGSGLLKDTVTLACIGMVTYEINRLFLQRKVNLGHILILLLSVYCIFSIRKFVLQAFLPAVILWISTANLDRIRPTILKIMFLPITVIVIVALSYFFISKVGEGDKKYSLENLGETSRVTAYDIRFWTGKDAGSGYTLGELDGSISSMLTLAPQAINVTLFRPYPWEIRNVLMVLSSLESTALFFITIYCLLRYGGRMLHNWSSPEVLFCLVFALVFAFGAGVSTYNFGSLTRYKIPILPFYLIALILMCSPPSSLTQKPTA